MDFQTILEEKDIEINRRRKTSKSLNLNELLNRS